MNTTHATNTTDAAQAFAEFPHTEYSKDFCGTEEAWLQARTRTVGASEGASVLGCSPYMSRFELWARKSGKINMPVRKNEAMAWGLRLESAIREEFTERTGIALHVEPPFTMYTSNTYPFMSATLDASYGIAGENVAVEIKSVHSRREEEWADGPPRHYWVQVQHQLAVTGWSRGVLLVLFGGQSLQWFDISRDEEFIAYYVRELESFWSDVQSGREPARDESESTVFALSRIEPAPDTVLIDDEVLQSAAKRLDVVSAQISELEREKRSLQAQVIARIGTASGCAFPDGTGYTYKLQNRKESVVAATSFRVLRRVVPK